MVAWFSGNETLDSGWAQSQQLLNGAADVVEAREGEGKVLVMGPEVTFRGEPDGTFKLLFNSFSTAPPNRPHCSSGERSRRQISWRHPGIHQSGRIPRGLPTFTGSQSIA